MPRVKKEKYIRETVTSGGNPVFKIEIRAYDQVFRKSVLVSEFGNRKEALDHAKQLRDQTLAKMSAGYTVSGFKTVRELYEKTFDLFPMRMKTRKRHDFFYKKGIAPYSDTTIDKITSADIQESINNYAKTHTNRQTSGLLSIWRQIFRCAVMMNINVVDRTIAVTIPECMEDNPRKKEISSADLDKFLDVLFSYNLASVPGLYRSRATYYAIQIMRYCGLRPSEAFALLKSDIHLADGYISITKASHSTQTSMLELGKTKTLKSKRNVPIPADLKPILKDCLAWSRNDLLLADYYGNLFAIDEISQLVSRVAKQAKVTFNMYMLRHQFSTDLFNSGVTPNVIRDLMGHESATMSLDYATSSEEDREKAVNARRFS